MSSLRIAYYCQHVLGIGHVHRSIAICQALALRHEVTLILGGPAVSEIPDTLSVFQLPGLKMDAEFKNLQPVDNDLELSDVKKLRLANLRQFFTDWAPEIFIVELYPFGRKAFRFELDPLLRDIRNGLYNPDCKCYISLRDILVERPDDKEKFEARALDTTNSLFDGLLIHSDPEVITLDETFSRYNDITIPIAYTGFVTKSYQPGFRPKLRHELGLGGKDKLIVVSIGGGNVGSQLLKLSLAAFNQLPDDEYFYHLVAFAGPYLDEHIFQTLSAELPERATLLRFSNRFQDWLQAADLSISMAGYNTCMDIVQCGVPAIVLPFAQNQEQRFRAERLSTKGAIKVLTNDELVAENLQDLMRLMTLLPRTRSTIDLDGANNTLAIIETFHQKVGRT
ncbi:glycosyltransferase family protein [Desulfosediminicola ganghwensis]|uniref:glycosyltransferase family protein n=1 Tax=Desulfosediminicola ganghwensis TaxID=2569540 RepID=UPI0010AC194B|nr:glycosyltransferase [Desulfosediminicola ganghwensis]